MCKVGALGWAVLSISGCSSYMENRAADAQDCLGFYVGWGLSLPLTAGIEASIVPIGVGVMSGPEGYASAYGSFGRVNGDVKLGVLDMPFNIIRLVNLGVSPIRHGGAKYQEAPYLGGTAFFDSRFGEKGGWNTDRWGRMGAHAGVLIFHVGGYVEVIEIADYLVGLFGFDLCGDDSTPETERPDSADPNGEAARVHRAVCHEKM